MAPKRRRSSAGEHLPVLKKPQIKHPLDHLSDELLIRILHNLPIQSLLQCQRLSRRFYALAGDSQIWKSLYYDRFVLPRALRIPGIKTAQRDNAFHFSSRRSKWLDEDALVNRADGKVTNWKMQYKLRHNWSIGACNVQEIHVADRPSVPSMLVRLADGVVVTADKEEGLRAWDLKGKDLIAKCELDGDNVPTCLAVDEQESEGNGLGIAVGFVDGGWGSWRLDVQGKAFGLVCKHPASSNGTLGAVAYAHPYILTVTDAQLLSLYTFDLKSSPTQEVDIETSVPLPLEDETEPSPKAKPPQLSSSETNPQSQPHLLASLKSHTSWPPLSLSIRTTPTTLIAGIAYSQPTYLSGYTIGLQELHLNLSTGQITFSRLASSLPQGFSSLLSPSTSPSASGTASPIQNDTLQAWQSSSSFVCSTASRPTSLSYAHPYILATHPDNTLTLYLCTSSSTCLSLSPGTKLWGHTSSVSSAEITARGKAVSVSTRGGELRVWELEGGGRGGGSTMSSRARKRAVAAAGGGGRSKASSFEGALEKSVQIRAAGSRRACNGDGDGDSQEEEEARRRSVLAEESEARKQWVGFDDEMVIVLQEYGKGTQALMVYDFT